HAKRLKTLRGLTPHEFVCAEWQKNPVNFTQDPTHLTLGLYTYYNWKKKYGGLGVPELRRLKQLEEENQQLKQLVTDLSLDKQMLQDVLKKKF
ncbi:hypothetical protein D0N36_20050, partial [Hymenobacter lapidiphilus]